MQRLIAAVVASLLLAPLGARAADLVVWWEKGFYPQEEEAVREIIAAFEQKTGKQVEVVEPAQQEIFAKTEAALAAGQPPDFMRGNFSDRVPRWAYEDRLVDLKGAIGPLVNLFDADAIDASTLLNGSTGQRGLYALPTGRSSNHIHVWNSLLERAGFTLAEIPKGWEAFWSFWCDRVQPAVRQATGRQDIWGVGLPMSAAANDTDDELVQFQLAYGAPWRGRNGRPQVDDPAVRAGLIRALEAYTAIYRKGCTPPDSTSWKNIDNNDAFLSQTVVMTANGTLSIPGQLRAIRPDDYYKNAATIDWPDDASGQPLVLVGHLYRAVVFKAGRNPALAEEFVRFLVEDGWLAHWLDFAGDRYLPPMRQLMEQPFWLNPNDPHRMRAAIQNLSRVHQFNETVGAESWRLGQVWQENVWGQAVHRVAADGISPEQAVDEAIARIKQILSE
jgi:multiple sugar transport system substrate-binding protein